MPQVCSSQPIPPVRPGTALRLCVLLALLLGLACGGKSSSAPPPASATPVIASFTATPTAILVGSSATLAWVVSGATSVSLDTGIGTVTGNSIQVLPSATTTYTLTAANGGVKTTAQATVQVTATSYTVTFNAGAGGTLNAPGAQTVPAGGSSTSVAAFPTAGYTFLDWTGTGLATTSANPLIVTPVNANLTITANFTNLNVVRFVAGPGGTLTAGLPNQGVPTGGNATPVTAAASPGYVFLNWTGTGGFVPTTTPTVVVQNVASGMTLTANFGRLPVLSYFTASASAIGAGKQGELNWGPMSFTTSARIDPEVGVITTFTSSSYAIVQPAATTTYTLTAANALGTSTSTVTIQVGPLPVISAFTPSPAALTAGQATTLAWTVTGATSLTLDNGIGAVTGTSLQTTPGVGSTPYTLSATNTFGTVTKTVTVTSGLPVALTYATNPATYLMGAPILANPPSNGGNPLTNFTVAPTLPAGLSLNPATGVLSGTPTATAAINSYLVTASNAYGPASTTLVLTVTPAPPVIGYSGGSLSFPSGTAVNLTPVNTGGPVTLWAIKPALPAGLDFSPATGQIVGIAGGVPSAQTYTVTATNAGGTGTALLNLAITALGPVVSYPHGYYAFQVNTPITALVPNTTGGGTVTGWSLSPALPAGLQFDTTSGILSGTPTAPAAAANYTVIATNSGGQNVATLTLAASIKGPSILVQPSGQILTPGAVPTFSVTASGTGALTYQWCQNGHPIAGATTASYAAPAFQASASGTAYTVVVGDGSGTTVTSNPAVVALLPDLATWLAAHPSIAAAVLWQTTPAGADVYLAPTDADKLAWANWSASQQADLNLAYVNAAAWYAQGAPAVTMTPGEASANDQPTNWNLYVNVDGTDTMAWLSPAYLWQLYTANAGFALMLEATGQLPWSLTTDTDPMLRFLLDSATLGWRMNNGYFAIGTYPEAELPALRANSRPHTSLADPRWTYRWLAQTGLIGPTRLATIGNLLDWMRQNLWHFFGADTFGIDAAIWGYRGYSPISQIVAGTVDTNNPQFGSQHWTAGCHGSVGFLHAALAALNIPVQPIWVCGHELAYFMTEDLYLDHGDDPYNALVRGSARPSLDLLLDGATWHQRFVPNDTDNITDPNSPAAAYIGYSTYLFN